MPAMDDLRVPTQACDYFQTSADEPRPIAFDDFSSTLMYSAGASQDLVHHAIRQWSVDQDQGSVATAQEFPPATYPMESIASGGGPVTTGFSDPDVYGASVLTQSSFLLPDTSGSCDMAATTHLNNVAFSHLYPEALADPALFDYDGLNCVSNMTALSSSAAQADQVNRPWMEMAPQLPMEPLSLDQVYEDHVSLHSSQDGMPSEDGRSNVWTASTMDSPDYLGSAGDGGTPALSSYPMTRTGNSSYNYSCFSADSGDYPAQIPYLSSVVTPSSRRSSMVQVDRFALDSNLQSLGEGMTAQYGQEVHTTPQPTVDPGQSARSTTAPR